MGVKKFKPVTPSLRFKVISDFSEITKSKPERSLLRPLKKTGGRGYRGRICVRRRGGGHKRRYRVIDFKRDKFDMEAKVIAIEYDPNRSARIALVEYLDKERRYIIWPKGLNVGDRIMSVKGRQIDIKPGNCMELKYIPLGTVVHNVELEADKGATLVRSAGSWSQVLAREKGLVHLKLPSGEIRLVKERCKATIGQVGNVEHSSVVHGKAGRRRWLGRRPRVRGVAMNPVDHPHGGGEGKAGQGNPHPVSPWGKPAKGGKTRKPNKRSDKYIISPRGKRKR